jgi:hypothetical protein
MSENKTNTLINIEGKVAEKVYDDAGSPAAKKLGLALSTIADIPNTLLSPIKWANERVQLFFDNNNAKYKQRLEAIPEEKIVPVPTEIAIPILNRFQYVTNEALSEAFVNLLANASSSDTAALAHPSFVSIIDRLSPDEAKILMHFKEHTAIPAINVLYHPNIFYRNNYIIILDKVTAIEFDLDLTFPMNCPAYFDNLTSLGLMGHATYFWKGFEERFNAIVEKYADLIRFKKPDSTNEEDYVKNMNNEGGMFILTDYGKLFLDAITLKE